jgi:hypothetical protein
MARPVQSTQHSHGIVAHQGVNAHQGEVLLNSLRNQQPIKRVFMRHGQEQPTFLIHNPAMNLRQSQREIQLAQFHLDLDLPQVDHAADNPMVWISDATGGSGGEAGRFCQPPDQHTRIEKKAGATQGIRNSSARGASKSAWVCILPIRPPGCLGAETDRAAESCIAASSAPTSLRCSGDRRSSCCCKDGLIEVMRKPVGAKGHSRWVEPAFPQEMR